MAHGPDLTPGAPGDIQPGTQRGVGGYFYLAQHRNGQWGLFDRDGRLCFLRAVHDVCNEPSDTEGALASAASTRLRTWGFNAVGLGGDGSGRDDGMPFLGLVGFCGLGPTIIAPGVRLPDVFDPHWPASCAARAVEICAPAAATRDLIAWASDDALGWGSASAAPAPGLLQICLSLEPSFPAYHAAWEFLLALHAGRLEAVARAWGVPLANKEVVREMSRSETGIGTRGYWRDDGRWTREFARRYFTTTAAAIRAADSNHLVCGCRFAAPVPAAVLAEASYPAIDLPMIPWTDLPLVSVRPGPLLAVEVGWSDESFWGAAAPNSARPGLQRLTSVERMLRRARTALRRLARHPSVVGYVWRQWRDEPGDQPPFGRGLVHRGGVEARENSELIAEFNARAEALRRAAAKQLSP